MLTKEVSKIMPTPNKIGMHLKVTDDTQIVIDKTYWEQFIPGDGATTKIKQEIGKQMQRDIDNYKALKIIYDASAYDTAISQVEDGLNL